MLQGELQRKKVFGWNFLVMEWSLGHVDHMGGTRQINVFGVGQ